MTLVKRSVTLEHHAPVLVITEFYVVLQWYLVGQSCNSTETLAMHGVYLFQFYSTVSALNNLFEIFLT